MKRARSGTHDFKIRTRIQFGPVLADTRGVSVYRWSTCEKKCLVLCEIGEDIISFFFYIFLENVFQNVCMLLQNLVYCSSRFLETRGSACPLRDGFRNSFFQECVNGVFKAVAISNKGSCVLSIAQKLIICTYSKVLYNEYIEYDACNGIIKIIVIVGLY